MLEPDILLYGYGGHGRLIAELLYESGYKNIGVFDDNIPSNTNSFITYLGKYDSNLYNSKSIVWGIGNAQIRAKLLEVVKHQFVKFIHSSASISSSTIIHEGTVILQNVVIQSNVSIGANTLINASCVIDHDAHIQDFVDIGPMSFIANNAFISSLQQFPAKSNLPKFFKSE